MTRSYFYSRTSREVRLAQLLIVNLHTPFLLTHLSRGATLLRQYTLANNMISTHAPLARCDRSHRGGAGQKQHFYSRTSREVRLLCHAHTVPAASFLLTHLSRGATVLGGNDVATQLISTHAPLARCDQFIDAVRRVKFNFYSRTSREVRLCADGQCLISADFYSRTSREVRRLYYCRRIFIYGISTHAPLARCDRR